MFLSTELLKLAASSAEQFNASGNLKVLNVDMTLSPAEKDVLAKAGAFLIKP
jgi:hypothetical protein